MDYNEILKKLTVFNKIDNLKKPNFNQPSANLKDMTELFFNNMGYDENTVKQIEETIENSKSVNVWENALMQLDQFIDTVNFYFDSLDQKLIKDVVDLVMCCSGYYGLLAGSFEIALNTIQKILQNEGINFLFKLNDNLTEKFRKLIDKYYETGIESDEVEGILIKSLEQLFNNRDGNTISILNHTKNFFDGEQIQLYRDNLDSIISVLESIQNYLDLSAKIINSLYFKFEVPDIINIVIQLLIIALMSYLLDIFTKNSPKLKLKNNKFTFYLEQIYQTLYSCDSSDSLETMLDLSKFESLMDTNLEANQPMIVKLTEILMLSLNDSSNLTSIDESVIKDSHDFDTLLKDLNKVLNDEFTITLQKNLCNQCSIIPGILGGIGSVVQQVIDLMLQMLTKSLNTILVKLDKNVNQFKLSLFLDFSSQIISSLITMFEKMKFDNIELLFDLDFDKCILIFEEEVQIGLDMGLNIDVFEKLGLNPETMLTDPNETNELINEGYYTGNDLFNLFNSLFKSMNNSGDASDEKNKTVKVILKDKNFTSSKNTFKKYINFSVHNKTTGKYSVYVKYPESTTYKTFYTGNIVNDKTNKQDNIVNIQVPEQLIFKADEIEELNIFIKLDSGEKSSELTYYCDFENKSQEILKVENYTVKVEKNSDMKLPVMFRYLIEDKNKNIECSILGKYGLTVENFEFTLNDWENINLNLYRINLNNKLSDLIDRQPLNVKLYIDGKTYNFEIIVVKLLEDIDNPIEDPIGDLPDSKETPEIEEQDNESIVNFINEAIKKLSESDSLDLNSITKFIGKNKSYYDINKRIQDIKEV